MANGTFKIKKDIDRHGPRLMPSNCKNLDPPYLSLPTTFKERDWVVTRETFDRRFMDGWIFMMNNSVMILVSTLCLIAYISEGFSFCNCTAEAGVLVSSAQRANPRYFIMLCGISCELAGCVVVHRPIVDSESTIAG